MSLTLERLARRLDATPDEVRDALRRLRDDLTAPNAPPLAPLGTFRTEGGTLQFDPAPALEELVNERFAGLEAITLPSGSPSFSKKEHVASSASGAAAPPWPGTGDDAPREDTAPSTGEAPPPAERLATSRDPLRPPPDPTESELVGSALAPVPDSQTPPPRATAPMSAREAAAPKPAPKTTSTPPSTERPAATPSRTKGQPASPVGVDDEAETTRWGLVATAVAVLALLAFGAWFFLRPGGDEAPASPQVADTRPADPSMPDAPDAAADGGDAAADGGASPAPAEPPVDEGRTEDGTQTSPVPEAPAPPAENDVRWTTGSWTIVVASEPDQATAENLIQQFRSELAGLSPIGMLPDASDRYRVGVGQFDTLDDLRAALDQYRSRLPDGAWPLQIEPNQ